MLMRRLKSIDEIYEETKCYDLVITNDAALETALNARVDTVRIGTFAITPRHLARDMCSGILGSSELSDLELVARVSEETDQDFRYVYSEILNFREIRRYTADVRAHLTTVRSKRVYDSYCTLPTRERAMSSFDPTVNTPEVLRDKKVAVVGLDLFDDLDKHFIPLDFDDIDIFTNGDFDMGTIHEVGNDRQLAENAVDLIDSECPTDYAIVLKASSPIADAVRAALYKRNLPFVNTLTVRDLAPIRDYISFLSYAMDYETARVGQVKELFAGLNGFFTPGREGFLISKLSDDDMRQRAKDFRDIMRDMFYDGMTFAQVMELVCDRIGKARVGMVLKSLGLTDNTVTPSRLAMLRYAVDNVTELKHNEEIPDYERTGVLIADCSNSVFIDKPVVIYLGMEQDWNVTVTGKKYLDAELESEKNAIRLTALLQQGDRRIYCVNATKNGKKARPCLTFDQVIGHPCKTFEDVAPLKTGRWASRTEVRDVSKGEAIIDGAEPFDKPFSKSSFNAYYSCPRMFMFNSLLKSEDQKSNEFGTLVHSFAELRACYPEVVREIGLDRLATIISDRYSGLSSPMMTEVDSDAVERAMYNISRYLDLKQVTASLDTSNSMRDHPNRFMEELGLETTSTMCEKDYRSTQHRIHGEFDLIWRGTVTDYKTGGAKDCIDIAKAMSFGSKVDYPEFQPLIYLALASELPDSTETFEMFYAMDNDVESGMAGYDITRNIRTIRIRPGNLQECMRDNPALIEGLETKIKKDLKPFATDILNAVAQTAVGEPKDWSSDATVINAVISAGHINEKDPESAARTAVDKLCTMLSKGIIATERLVEIPRQTLDDFLEELDRMHAEASVGSLTDLPARPLVDCRKCKYFEACTADVLRAEDIEGN